jgi:hypothetical protein
MKFTVRLPDEWAARVNKAAKQTGKSRRALIREALKERLGRNPQNRWPKLVREFHGIPDAPRFEEYRKDVRSPHRPFQPILLGF